MPEAFGAEATHYCKYRDVCAWAILLLSQQENTWNITQALMEATNHAAPDPPIISSESALEAMSDTRLESGSESALEVISNTKSESSSESESCVVTSEAMSEDENGSDEDLNVVLETTRGNVTFSTS